MSKKDKLEKEFASLMSWRDKIFQVFLALLTGEVIVIYSVVSGEKPMYLLTLVFIGLVVIVGLAFKIKKINDEIDENIDEMEKI